MPERQPINYPIESRFHRVVEAKRPEFLSGYTAEQFDEMERKRQILSSLAYFIGKDFKIPVEYNEPGKGWHWDFAKNIIRIDPEDLLNKSEDYLRFVISHEGGHRRVSRTDFIPEEIWRQPGFSVMMNAIEDPRDNNFVADNYPRFAEQMTLAYEEDLAARERVEDSAKEEVGFKPRFIEASFEYIRQWFCERQNQPFEISADLPEEVRETVKKTLPAAADSWWRYPSREEADRSEETIKKYAELSYKINLKKIWPEFRKLVDEDRKDAAVQKMLDEMQKQKGEKGKEGEHQGGEGSPEGGASSPKGEVSGLPQELRDKLTLEEQKQLEEAIAEAIERAKKGESEKEAGKPAAVDLDSLSEELKQKLRDYFDTLPAEKKRKLLEKAEAALREIEKEFDEQIAGKLTESPVERAEREAKEAAESEEKKEDGKKGAEKEKAPPAPKRLTEEQQESMSKYRNIIETQLKTDANAYEKNRREVLPLIDELEQELREIFVKRRASGWQGGFKTGKRVDIKRRIQEKAKSVPVVESRAWQKRELPQEKDYAISLLVDLSNSMRGDKIAETFKATIILAEVLNRLSIKTEILGFNDRLYEYQKFGQDISTDVRNKMGVMLEEVRSDRARYNDDGWAVGEASARLAKQAADQKFLVVLSDGEPDESPAHRGREFNLNKVVKKITEESSQKLIGLGLLSDAVVHYYPRNISGISIDKLNKELVALLKDIIEKK